MISKYFVYGFCIVTYVIFFVCLDDVCITFYCKKKCVYDFFYKIIIIKIK